MTRNHLRREHGGNPAQGPAPDMANPTPSPRAGEDFPDAPDNAAGTVQDQPDLDDFAARLGLTGEEDHDADTSSAASSKSSPATSSDTSSTEPEPSDSTKFADRASGAGARAVGAVARGLDSLSTRLSKLAERIDS